MQIGVPPSALSGDVYLTSTALHSQLSPQRLKLCLNLFRPEGVLNYHKAIEYKEDLPNQAFLRTTTVVEEDGVVGTQPSTRHVHLVKT